jgi:hypothetical protein
LTISLLTTPVVLSSSTLALQFETNAIHDNGATILLCSQEVADAIGLDGESRPLGLAVFGNPNQVQQAFKTMVAIADAEGNHIGNAVVHVVDEFVKVRAVDWSTHSKEFPHLPPNLIAPCGSMNGANGANGAKLLSWLTLSCIFNCTLVGESGMLHHAAEENTRPVIQDVDARNTTLLFNNRRHSKQLTTNSSSKQNK